MAWGSYSLTDFIPIEPVVYYRIFVRLNETIWPSQLFTWALGGFIIYWLVRHKIQWAMFALAALWFWVGYNYHFQLVAELNWFARYSGSAFLVQGGLLLLIGLLSPLQRIDSKRLVLSGSNLIGFGLIGFAWLLFPFGMLGITNTDWNSLMLFGTMPDPTALFTIGVIILSARSFGWIALVIPLLWLIYSGLTWYAIS